MRPLSERLRYIQLKGHLYFGDKEWVWVAAPDTECVVREIRAKYLAEIERRNENDLSAKILKE